MASLGERPAPPRPTTRSSALGGGVASVCFAVCFALAACASTAPARSARAAVAGAPPIVAEHRVAAGETAFGIARRYGVSVEALAAVNRLDDPSRLIVGRVLDIPAPSDATEDATDEATATTELEVKRTERSKTTETEHPDGSTTRQTATKTLTQLTERTHVDEGPRPKSPEPARSDANGAAKRDAASDGAAGAARPRPSNRAEVDPARVERAKEAARQGDLGKLQEEMRPRRADGVPEGCEGASPAAKLAVDRYIWPVDGVVISSFGKRDGLPHEGIDIAAPIGSPIWASRPGTVLYSGEQAGYGVLVILRHEGDVVSIYAHNAKNCVAEGATVEQGQVIGLVGASGGATSPSVHFELRIGNKTVNPRVHLTR